MVLKRAQTLGFLGGKPLTEQIHHAEGFVAVWDEEPPLMAVDLGSGGGLPGLVVALAWPSTAMVLLDSNQRRTDFLRWSVRTLALEERVKVLRIRAETMGRDLDHRGRYCLVMARSFARPSVTAECSAPLLRVGGRLIVSEPPGGSTNRWPEGGLAALGMRAVGVKTCQASYQVILQAFPCPGAFPRRVGVPHKRPLF